MRGSRHGQVGGPRSLAAALAAALVMAACGGSTDTEPAASAAAPPTSAAVTSTTVGEVVVSSCGIEYRYPETPRAVLATDTGAMELLAALGVADSVVGWFGTGTETNLAEQTRPAVLSRPRLGGSFPFPSYEAILAQGPDLVVSYGFNESAGFTSEALQGDGIGSYSFGEACPTPEVSNMETFFDDVLNIGRIMGVESAAQALVSRWRAELDSVKVSGGEPVKVLLIDYSEGIPFTSGEGSLADDMITRAGGVNIFGDSGQAFLTPSWEEVLSRNPDLIIEGGSEDFSKVKAFLEADPALSQMSAVQGSNFGDLRFQHNVPGPQAIEGVRLIAEAIAARG